MKINVLFFVFLLLTISAYSQKQNNNWYFGDTAAISFSTKDGKPVSLTNSQMVQYEGCASISDKFGHLLFYTNGMTVWNKNHKQMPNGFGLYGNRHSTQSALIVPKPEDDNIYYVFTAGISGFDDSVQRGINYSIVDMRQDNGYGDIIQKNINLLTPATEKLTATLHKNGKDYWILVHEYPSNTFRAYLLTKSGLSINPIKTSIGVDNAQMRPNGYMKFSPDSKRIALAFDEKPLIEVYDFDNSTGIISNLKTITFPNQIIDVYSVEFSPDCKKLYVEEQKAIITNICQFDINSNDEIFINNSKKILKTIDLIWPGNLLLAPDNNIYYVHLHANCLGAIYNPNDTGKGVIIVDTALILERGRCEHGLPNNIIAISQLEVLASSSPACEGDSIFLMSDISLINNNAIYQWTGPNGFKSNLQNPVLANATTALNGEYIVTATLDGKSACDTIFLDIKPKPTAIIKPAKYAEICQGEEFSITGESNQANVNYLWSTAETTKSIKINKSNKYYLTVENSSGCTAIDSFELKVNPNPEAKIVVKGRTTFCAGDSVILSLENSSPECKNTWSNGMEGSSIVVKSSGTYKVTVTNTKTNCKAEDSVKINVMDKIQAKITSSTGRFSICGEDKLVLKAEPKEDGLNYQWSTNEITPEIEVTKAGKYYVIISSYGQCAGYDTVIVSAFQKLTASIIGQDTVCTGSEVILKPSGDFDSYQWSTGETTKEIRVTKGGNYSVAVISSNGCAASAQKQVTEVETNISVSGPIDFGRICSGESAEKEISIENQGQNPVHIKAIHLSNNDDISITGNYDQGLQSKTSIKLKAVYSPTKLGQCTNSLNVEIDYPCAGSYTIPLQGTSIAKAIVWLPDTAVNINERVHIPVFASLTCGNRVDELPDYEGEISLDATAFNPISEQNSAAKDCGIINGERIIKISKGINSLSGSTSALNQLYGCILFADSNEIPLKLRSIKWNSEFIETEIKDGLLRIRGVCKPNLSRVELSKNTSLTINPAPANDFAEIKVEGKTNGIVKFEIYSLEGIEIGQAIIDKTSYSASTTIDLRQYSAGVYQIQAELEGEIIRGLMMVSN